MCTYAMGSTGVFRSLSNTYNENFCKKSSRMKAGLCSVINVWEYPKYTSLVSLPFPQRAKIYIFELPNLIHMLVLFEWPPSDNLNDPHLPNGHRSLERRP